MMDRLKLNAAIISFSIFLLLCINFQLSAQENKPIAIDTQKLTELPNLKPGWKEISEFDKYSQEVEDNAIRNARALSVQLSFYRYVISEKNETLFRIAARCNIRQETIATLNAINTPNTTLTEGTVLIIPNADGIFVYEEPKSSLELLVAKSDYAIEQKEKILYNISLPSGEYAGLSRNFYFVQNAKLNPTERAYFLDTSLRLPLDSYLLSSRFGNRVSPISGSWQFHNGIDMAADEGTPVYACKEGIVQTAKRSDPTYGNYIVLGHESGMTSLYAHLSNILVSANENVFSGQRIGLVGQTGLATGPHLHFEIRKNGIATDPERLFSR